MYKFSYNCKYISGIRKISTRIIVSIPKYKYSYTCTYHVISVNV